MAEEDVVKVPRAEWEAWKALEARGARLEQAAPARPRPSDEDGGPTRTDRRSVLKHGAALAAGALAGGTVLAATQAAPAGAVTGAMQYGTLNDAGSDHTDLVSSSIDYVMALHMTCTEGTGSCLQLDDGMGGSTGTYGGGVGYLLNASIDNKASSFPAVNALTNGSGPAVYGYGTSGPGVKGSSGGTGVLGTSRSSSGFGVTGVDLDDFGDPSGTNGGVAGQLGNPNNSSVAVSATTAGTGSALEAQITNGFSASPAIYATTAGSGPAILAQLNGSTAPAISGDSSLSGGPGVYGVTSGNTAAGVQGISQFCPGVQGQTVLSTSTAAGVAGTATKGPGVSGTATTGNGVYGKCTNGGFGVGVYGEQSGIGSGVRGDCNGGTGVFGNATSGIGVKGTATTGRGAVFAGQAAQINLVPATASIHPTAGKTGDLFLDSTARLWLCTVGGTIATWKQVQVI